jgi:signal peptidase I
MNYNCPNCFNALKRGEVAIFIYPNNRTRHFVKRIVAVPDDTIEINAGDFKLLPE